MNLFLFPLFVVSCNVIILWDTTKCFDYAVFSAAAIVSFVKWIETKIKVTKCRKKDDREHAYKNNKLNK